MKKKTLTALLTLITTATLTACSLEFSTNGTYQIPGNISQIPSSFVNQIAEIVDGTDFRKDDFTDLAAQITGWAQEFADESDYLNEFEKAKLIRVVDGDTIIVEIQNNQYYVRMIGIDTPESVASEEYLERTGKENTQAGKDASQFTKDVLSNIQTVYLEKDISETDRYDRLLRYVWLEIPGDKEDIEEISTKMLNAILLKEGVANAVVYEPDTSYEEYLELISDSTWDRD